MQIVDSITQERGIQASRLPLHSRFKRPIAGDHVRWADGTLGRIWTIGGTYAREDHAQVCENQGSAFMGEDYVSISGGPFRHIALSDLEPEYSIAPSWFWNWGSNHAGADKGCSFAVNRPIFRYTGEGR